jgi:hypothetical protein
MPPSAFAELNQFTRDLEPRLSGFADDVFCFEHGNSTEGGPMGCGVDHAHMHMVPLSFDLIDAAVSVDDRSIEWQVVADVDCFSATIPAQGEYISLWHPKSGRGAIGRVQSPQSQWVRRVIAEKLGRVETWDYRQNPNVANVMTTVSTFR